MAAHILLISAVAPALARVWLRHDAFRQCGFAPSRSLAYAATAQLALLWAWHAPTTLSVSSTHAVTHALASTLLLMASLAFWLAILSKTGAGRLQGVFALLATGKLSCLLGALLLFAPRVLDGLESSHLESALADQRLAGLMMLAVCPVCYVLTGIKITADWLRELEAGGSPPQPLASS